MKRTIHQLTQGAPDWLAHRALILNASEAPAVMGASKYLTRSALLQQKATGIVPEVGAGKQFLFDRGHAVEAPTVALIEADIGDSLAPVVASIEIDGLTLGASYDGLTLFEDVAAEVKLWNEALAEQIRRGEIDPHYYWQLEQQFIVTPSLERIIFATSDGTRERFVSMEYRPVPGRREQLLAAWKQFDADLAQYVPTEVKEMPKAEVTIALPTLFIHAKGEITTSNMKEYGEALAKRLAEVRAIALISDQDFSNAKESAKLLRENIVQARAAKEGMLAQTVTVGEAAKMIDAWCEDMRLTALKLEQDVEREDRLRKAAMIAKAKGDYEAHIEALKANTGGPWILLQAPDWAGVIKGKRNFTSMQDALDTALANGKIAADESARKIRAALAALDEESKGFEHLFADRLAFISKSVEDVRSLARARITEHRAAEERRAAELAERERERIRKEEAERADREARQREAEALRASEAAQRAAAPAPTQPPAAAPIASPAVSSQAANVVPLGTRAPETGARLRLGEINSRLAPIALTAEGLATLGFQPVATEKAAKLYRASDLDRICAALVSRLTQVREALAA